MKSYRRLVVTCPNPDEDSFLFHELGALGTEVSAENSLTVFIPDEQSIADAVSQLCEREEWKIESFECCENKNWVQACAEIWQPITVDTLTIVPLVETTRGEKPNAGTIFIIPGEGFGTGHHPSTRLALGHIQRSPLSPARSVLDFGTGNGILAIGAALQFPDARIEAIDNDPAAISNARENVEINHLISRISLSVKSIENTVGSYDMIIANIYAEVLCRYHDEMLARTRDGGVLILAGIMNSRADLVRDRFCSDWRLCAESTEDGWTSFRYEKNAPL